MRFVLTGRLPTPRAELMRMITRAGHSVESRIYRGVNYLVRGNINDSEKIRQARQVGVTVITYQQLMRLLEPVHPVSPTQAARNRQGLELPVAVSPSPSRAPSAPLIQAGYFDQTRGIRYV